MNQTVELTRSPDLCFAVLPEDKGQRLDLFLSSRCGGCSRSQFKKIIQEGRALVNDRPVKASYEIRSGDRISVWLPVLEPSAQLVPQPMPLDILYEDEDLVVVNKAPGLVVHPGSGHAEGTLVHGLLAHCGRLAIQGAPLRPGIVHRLDRDTSGALVVAKSDRAYLDLIRQFKRHEVRKEYLALVYGRFAEPGGNIRTWLDRHPKDRKKMAVSIQQGREAISHWQVERAWADAVTLVRVTIETGRTHQIRVHLSHLQHPVVGDATYGGGQRRVRLLQSTVLRQLLAGVQRQMLHAWRLAFRHPSSQKALSFIAPLPTDFAHLFAELERAFPEDA